MHALTFDNILDHAQTDWGTISGPRISVEPEVVRASTDRCSWSEEIETRRFLDDLLCSMLFDRLDGLLSMLLGHHFVKLKHQSRFIII